MSLDKSIQSGKSHRKPYRGVKAVDATCRNHGSCKWCEGNRTHKNGKRELAPPACCMSGMAAMSIGAVLAMRVVCVLSLH